MIPSTRFIVEIGAAVEIVPDVVDRYERRVREPRLHPSLAEESRLDVDQLDVGADRLQRDVTCREPIPAAANLPHPAFAEKLTDDVALRIERQAVPQMYRDRRR